VSISSVLLGAFALQTTAYAQEEESTQPVIEEVIVTANKRT
jgi:hypothetical protein